MAHTEIVTRTNIIDAFRPVIMHYYFAMGRMDLSVFRELFTVTCIFRVMHAKVRFERFAMISYDFRICQTRRWKSLRFNYTARPKKQPSETKLFKSSEIGWLV